MLCRSRLFHNARSQEAQQNPAQKRSGSRGKKMIKSHQNDANEDESRFQTKGNKQKSA
jgi:hypothetical protein